MAHRNATMRAATGESLRPQRVDVRRLGVEQIGLIADIDRSERVDVEYNVRKGRIVERPVSMIDVPAWDATGTGPHSVAGQIAFCEPLVARGAVFFGAFDGNELVGVAVVDPAFERSLAWLAFLHVSRRFRRRGVASALWDAAVQVAAGAGARTMYVSATPTGSAVGFYLSRGCEPAERVHPALFEMEPDDVHLVCAVHDRSA